ncbi:MAG: T9SS type A sorting domain-containing protein [Winogradskyella sp.]|nr:T9SS type A sorting domain-containing protein [Winogradskyella sp.]
MKRIIIFLVFLCSSYFNYAGHAKSGVITYKCIGPNMYEATLTFYRDCNGVNPGNTFSMALEADNFADNLLLQIVSIEDVTNYISSFSSACGNGSGSFGVEKHTFKGTFTLPPNSGVIKLSIRRCCRTLSTNTFSTFNSFAYSLFLKTVFNSDLSVCNNAPNFENELDLIVGQTMFTSLSLAATDPDGDTLTYELSPPLDNDGVEVQFIPPNSYLNPLTGVSPANIDLNTGLLSFSATNLQAAPIGILIKEYRDNIEIARYYLEHYINSVPLGFDEPAYIGADSSQALDLDITMTQAGASVVETDGKSLELTAGDSFCFTLDFNDDEGGNISTTSNASEILIGATYTTVNNGTNNLTAELCWTPTNADTGIHHVTFSAYDEGSSQIILRRDYIYSITVNENTFGVDNFERQNIKVYPNPVINSVFVSGLEESAEYYLYTIEGKLLKKGTVINNESIPIREITSEVLFIKLITKNQTEFKKLIKNQT